MAKYVIIGAGAIGGVMAAKLYEQGVDVVLVARGAQFAAIADHGLRVDTPDNSSVFRLPVVERVAAVDWTDDSIAVMAVKSQDTDQLLSEMVRVVPRSTPVLCAQNGVENERLALRRFPNVYGAKLSCSTSYFTPGVVVAHGSPWVGAAVVGRYPSGDDELVDEIVSALTRSSWIAQGSEKIMCWKYAKLLRNLSNAVSVVCGTEVRGGVITTSARKEAEIVFRTAAIEWVDEEEWNSESVRGEFQRFRSVGDITGNEGSSWQSLVRGTGSIEVDYLNGEVCLLGRLHGVPTPVNDLLCELANDVASRHGQPGEISEERFLERLG